MALIKSISGFRGTIGGLAGENLTPQDVVSSTAAYAAWIKTQTDKRKVIIGRDGRISGEIVSQLVASTLRSMGLDVVDLGLSTTPTVEMAVVMEEAAGGIILTASHNPKEWNALKLLNERGEFISGADGAQLLQLLEQGTIEYARIDQLGAYSYKTDFINQHIQAILNLPLVDLKAIKAKGFKVVVDAVNSTGALAVPPLLEALGCQVLLING
ncbi:MAG: phosphoglucosamine mutase, partial [Bacteroidetes bacterium]|nr:phosphoglucosamine mutase [Bacteroidota bacterium]